MLRGVLGVILGIVVGGLSIGGAEAIGHKIYPPPPGLDLGVPGATATLMETISLEAKIAVVAAWAVGVFLGSATAILVSGRQSWPAWVAALVLFSAALVTMDMIPHPAWMVWTATAMTLVSAISAAYIWARS
jgi:hypothetical protein